MERGFHSPMRRHTYLAQQTTIVILLQTTFGQHLNSSTGFPVIFLSMVFFSFVELEENVKNLILSWPFLSEHTVIIGKRRKDLD